MRPLKNTLIIANSGRMLAQFAKKNGLIPFVIDCFADADTQQLALVSIKVNTLALNDVKTAFFNLTRQYIITHAIYGSGLEKYPQTLEFLHHNITVVGNSLAVFTAVQKTAYFFSRLSQLHIPYPDVTFQPPDNNDQWLIKPKQGEGGLGIEQYTNLTETSNAYYWQKYLSGIPLSVLFVANGDQYKIIGFHQQLITQIGNNAFVFSGLFNYFERDKNMIQTVTLWLTKLVPEFALKGINSLDFIVKNQQCYLLEINARPSASLQLYHSSLLLAHIHSCLLNKLASTLILNINQAYKIIFARTDILIKKTTRWPSWVFDRPVAGSFIYTGSPICSIIARGKNEQQVRKNLLLREQIITQIL